MALVPALLALFLFALAVFLITMEFKGAWDGLLSTLTFLRVKSPDTARAIAGAILGGMISLTVFSFSMVMVVVNQASSNYSPKITEGFINNRSNKYILGIFVGTIIVSLTTLMRIEDSQAGVPDLAICLTIVLTLYSISLFVKFISNISSSVKITNLVEQIYFKTKNSIENDSKGMEEIEIESDGWPVYEAGHSGYFQQINTRRLIKILDKNDLILKVIPATGYYFMKKSPLFQLNLHPQDREVIGDIRNTFITYSGEHISENEFYGFRQLREIAVKGLSPGINDPGIAKLCIDYLGELLSMWLSLENKDVEMGADRRPRIIHKKYDVQGLVENCITPIKTYGKRDFTIINSLLQMLLQLSYHDEKREKIDLLNKHATAILDDANEGLENFADRNIVNKTVTIMNETTYFHLPYLNNEKQL